VIADFYDQLAPYYHYLYADWETSSNSKRRTDEIGREFLAQPHGPLMRPVVLVRRVAWRISYAVTASIFLRRWNTLAGWPTLQLTIDFAADMRTCALPYRGRCRHRLRQCSAHLLTDDDIWRAFQQFHACTTPQGGCIISVRDYAGLERGGRQIHPRPVHDIPDGRLVMFDVWDFDGEYYDLTLYAVEDRGQDEAVTHVMRGGRYYCVTIERLEQLLQEAGFKQVVTLRDRFFQPAIVGSK
jgi:hypothetical protein